MSKTFTRKDTHKKARLPVTWRKPKGITNKKRLNRKGHTPNVRTGYGTKQDDRNKTQGLQRVLVQNISQLKEINPKTQCAIIASVGKKKKMELLKEAQTLKIKIVDLNVKRYEDTVNKFLEQRKKETKEKKAEKAKKESEKKEEEKKQEKQTKTEAQEMTEEEKKKAEKAEKDKILTKSR